MSTASTNQILRARAYQAAQELEQNKSLTTAQAAEKYQTKTELIEQQQSLAKEKAEGKTFTGGGVLSGTAQEEKAIADYKAKKEAENQTASQNTSLQNPSPNTPTSVSMIKQQVKNPEVPFSLYPKSSMYNTPAQQLQYKLQLLASQPKSSIPVTPYIMVSSEETSRNMQDNKIINLSPLSQSYGGVMSVKSKYDTGKYQPKTIGEGAAIKSAELETSAIKGSYGGTAQLAYVGVREAAQGLVDDASLINKNMQFKVPYTNTITSTAVSIVRPDIAINQFMQQPEKSLGSYAFNTVVFSSPELAVKGFKSGVSASGKQIQDVQTNMMFSEYKTYQYENKPSTVTYDVGNIAVEKNGKTVFEMKVKGDINSIDLVSPQRTLNGERISTQAVMEARGAGGLDKGYFKTPVYDNSGRIVGYESIEQNSLKPNRLIGDVSNINGIQISKDTQIPLAKDKLMVKTQTPIIDMISGKPIEGFNVYSKEIYTERGGSSNYGITQPIGSDLFKEIAVSNANENAPVIVKYTKSQQELPVMTITKKPAYSNLVDPYFKVKEQESINLNNQEKAASPKPFNTAEIKQSAPSEMSQLYRSREGMIGQKLREQLKEVDPYQLSGTRLFTPNYEKVTIERYSPIEVSKDTSLFRSGIVNIKQEGEVKIKSYPILINKTNSVLGNKEIVIPEYKQVTAPISIIEVKPAMGTKTRIMQDVMQKQNSMQEEIVSPKTDLFTPTQEVQRNKSRKQVVPPKEEELPLIPIIQTPSKLSGRKRRFKVLARRRGKFSIIGESESVQGAVNIGEQITGSNAGASFKIVGEEGGNVIPSLFSNRYRLSTRESGVIIQKNKFRISSGGERAEITGAGLRALKMRKGGLKL